MPGPQHQYSHCL